MLSKCLSLLAKSYQKVCFHHVDWQLVSSVVMPLFCVVVYILVLFSDCLVCSGMKKLGQAYVL